MIVSCGEALIDFLPRAGADGTSVFLPAAGGSPFNVAIAMARLGAAAGFFGGISNDFFGDILRKALRDSGVDLSFVANATRPSTLAFVSLVDGSARYAFFDEGFGRAHAHRERSAGLSQDRHRVPFRLVQPCRGALRLGA